MSLVLLSVRALLTFELAASILFSSAGVVAVVVEEEDAAATMTGVAAADTVTGVASGTTLAAHMFEVIIVTAVERTEAGLREGMLPLVFYTCFGFDHTVQRSENRVRFYTLSSKNEVYLSVCLRSRFKALSESRI